MKYDQELIFHKYTILTLRRYKSEIILNTIMIAVYISLAIVLTTITIGAVLAVFCLGLNGYKLWKAQKDQRALESLVSTMEENHQLLKEALEYKEKKDEPI